jgi:hypothetical protein
MQKTVIIWFFIIAFLFSGCSTKNFSQKQTKIVVIKSPYLKFNDIGYIKKDAQAVELDLYSAGVSVERISIDNLICTKNGCMPKGMFNSRYLSSAYPDDIMQNILLAKPIFNGEALTKTNNGFVQKIHNQHVAILYRVTPKEVFFKDRKNRILVKLKDLQ